jgi:hypothetical protein
MSQGMQLYGGMEGGGFKKFLLLRVRLFNRLARKIVIYILPNIRAIMKQTFTKGVLEFSIDNYY